MGKITSSGGWISYIGNLRTAKKNNKIADKLEEMTAAVKRKQQVQKALDEYHGVTPTTKGKEVWYTTTNDVGEKVKIFGVPPTKIK